MAKLNPFHIERFFGREREIEQVKALLETRGVCAVTGLRGIGKSSLVSTLGGIVVDCMLHFDARSLLHSAAAQLVKLQRIDGPLRYWHVNNRVTPTEIRPLAGESITDLAREITCIMSESPVPFPIVLDEFQEIESAEGSKELIQYLFSNECQVRLVLTSSRTTRLDNLCESLEIDCGERVILERIPVEEWQAFITQKFRTSGKRCESAIVTQMYHRTIGHTSNMLSLSKYLWALTDHTADDDTLTAAFNSLLIDARSSLEATWVGLAYNEKRLLAAIGNDPTDQPQSRTWLSTHNFSSSSLARSMDGLKLKGLIYRGADKVFRVADPILEVIFGGQ